MEKGQFINIHCHGLHGVDDGAETWEEAKEMLAIATEEGICKQIYTFHCIPGEGEVTAKNADLDKALTRLEELRAYAAEHYPQMELLAGSEVLFDSSAVEALREGNCLTLAGTRYVLIEFPFGAPYDRMCRGVRELTGSGYRPVLAHAERYDDIYRKDERIRQLISMGVYIQINSRSFMGGRLDKETKWVTALLRQGMVHFIADDSHSAGNRRPLMAEAYDRLARTVDEAVLERVFRVNPQALLKDRII